MLFGVPILQVCWHVCTRTTPEPQSSMSMSLSQTGWTPIAPTLQKRSSALSPKTPQRPKMLQKHSYGPKPLRSKNAPALSLQKHPNAPKNTQNLGLGLDLTRNHV